ncbi:MAG: MBL fold metallo-hydrolase [Candidatus Heimdallarchaeota archaeon]|nr:MBL fold metallo-hydrolase [Candidatus Heimdallarchaeota archaeon]
MKLKLLIILPIAILIPSGILIYNYFDQYPMTKDPSTMKVKEVEITYLGIAGFKLKYEELVVYIDPFDIANNDNPILEKADYIISTHGHLDHCSSLDIYTLADDTTILLKSATCTAYLSNRETVAPGDNFEYDDISFEFVPMYTIDKVRSTGLQYHPQENNDVGVIVEINELRIYFTGSSDRIPEMKSIEADIILLPVSGSYFMNAEEAATALEDIQLNSDLQFAVPFHYGEHDVTGLNQGTLADVEEFKSYTEVEVIVLEPIPA